MFHSIQTNKSDYLTIKHRYHLFKTTDKSYLRLFTSRANLKPDLFPHKFYFIKQELIVRSEPPVVIQGEQRFSLLVKNSQMSTKKATFTRSSLRKHV